MVNKPIIYDNYLSLIKRTLISDNQVNYSQDIIVSRDMTDLCLVSNEAIKVILYIGHTDYNH